MQTPDTKKTSEPIRFDLTDHEIAAISRKRESVAQERERLDAGFTSLKLDYKANAERLDLDASELSRKIRDGFEMRPVDLEISFNDPERGRKTVRRLDTGETVRVEAMTALDVEQRELPIEAEQTPPAEVTNPHLDAEGNRTGTLSQTEGAENAGVTSVDVALDSAAAKSDQPMVDLDLAAFGSDYKLAFKAFKKRAKDQGWPKAAIDLLDDQIAKIGTREIVDQKDLSGSAFAVLAPHCERKGAE